MSSPFDQLISNSKYSLSSISIEEFSINPEDFEQWKKDVCFFTLKTSRRVGVSFCQTYDIRDFLLNYVLDNTQAIEYINKNYVK